MTRTALASTLIAVSLAVLAAQTLSGSTSDAAVRAIFIVLCLVGLRTYTIREFLLLGVALVLAVILWRSDNSATLMASIDLGAYFAAFIALLTALKIAAERSNSVQAVGRYLIRQPSSRRFVATAMGGHTLGVFLNFAAISLMAPLIQSATKHANGSIDRDLERRQMSARLRGFAWILLWAPTTQSQAVLLSLFNDVDQGKIVMIGTETALLMTGIGLVYDRWEWRGFLHSIDETIARRNTLAFARLGDAVDQNKHHRAGLCAAVGPSMIGAALHNIRACAYFCKGSRAICARWARPNFGIFGQ